MPSRGAIAAWRAASARSPSAAISLRRASAWSTSAGSLPGGGRELRRRGERTVDRRRDQVGEREAGGVGVARGARRGQARGGELELGAGQVVAVGEPRFEAELRLLDGLLGDPHPPLGGGEQRVGAERGEEGVGDVEGEGPFELRRLELLGLDRAGRRAQQRHRAQVEEHAVDDRLARVGVERLDDDLVAADFAGDLARAPGVGAVERERRDELGDRLLAQRLRPLDARLGHARDLVALPREGEGLVERERPGRRVRGRDGRELDLSPRRQREQGEAEGQRRGASGERRHRSEMEWRPRAAPIGEPGEDSGRARGLSKRRR